MSSTLLAWMTSRWLSKSAPIAVLVAALFATAPPAFALPPGFGVEEMVGGLEQPVAFAFAPDGRVFVAERARGTVRVIENGVLLEAPALELSVSSSGERGLLGLTLDPDFEENQFLYVLYSRSPSLQRISRFTIRGSRAVEETVIKDGIPAAVVRNGGTLAFGPDGKLYFTVGDTGDPLQARRVGSVPGKLHRINPDGSIPEDNPWEGKSAFCLGCRNSFDFAFMPGQVPVVIYATENGPTENDEINRILAGKDYGWPEVTGPTPDGVTGLESPTVYWTPTTAPVGIALYRGQNFPPNCHDNLFFAEYNTGRIMRFSPANPEAGRSVFLEGSFGPLFDVVVAPDGTLWFSSSKALFRIINHNPPTRFVRGDVDGHGGVTPTDALVLLSYLSAQGPAPECLAAGDANGDDQINLSDVSLLLRYVFGLVPVLPTPFPLCGVDPENGLDCASFRRCR